MAAAPLNVEMAVPVDAVPTAATIAVVAPDAATPPATPAAVLLNPPRSAFAPINNFLIRVKIWKIEAIEFKFSELGAILNQLDDVRESLEALDCF